MINHQECFLPVGYYNLHWSWDWKLFLLASLSIQKNISSFGCIVCTYCFVSKPFGMQDGISYQVAIRSFALFCMTTRLFNSRYFFFETPCIWPDSQLWTFQLRYFPVSFCREKSCAPKVCSQIAGANLCFRYKTFVFYRFS